MALRTMADKYQILREGQRRIAEQKKEESLKRRREFGQLDLSMLSSGMLQLVLQQQRERQARRRKQRRHAVIGGMGFTPSGRKTLLGE